MRHHTNACHCEPVWCSAQRIKITMTTSGSHTLIHAHWCGPLRGFPPVTILRSFRGLSNHACHCEEASGRRGNPFPKPSPERSGAPRSEFKSNNCRWQLHNNVQVPVGRMRSPWFVHGRKTYRCGSTNGSPWSTRGASGGQWPPLQVPLSISPSKMRSCLLSSI